MKNGCYAKIHVWSFGLALGVLWALSLLITAWVAMATGWGIGFVETMRTMYIGYAPTFLGGLIGGIWGFVDMFIGGVLIAALYNLFLCWCCRRLCGATTTPDMRDTRPKV